MNTISNDLLRDRIFRLLDERSIPQNEFADKLGVSPQTVTDWKKGKSRSYYSKLIEISRLLAIPLWDLVDEKKCGPGAVSDVEAALDQELISRLVQLTPEELEKVDAFVQGLLASH